MKEKGNVFLIVVIVVACIIILLLMGSIVHDVQGCQKEGMANFEVIDDSDYLVFDLDTKVVYYMFSTSRASGYQGYGYSYFAPYISENGKFCKYVEGKIIEIAEENNDT